MARQQAAINNAVIDEIRARLAKGKSMALIAMEMDMEYHDVYRIVRRLEKGGIPMPKRKRNPQRVRQAVEAYIRERRK